MLLFFEVLVNVRCHLQSLDEELEFIAVVFKLYAEVLVKNEVWCCVDPADKCNNLLKQVRTLLDRALLETVEACTLNKAVV